MRSNTAIRDPRTPPTEGRNHLTLHPTSPHLLIWRFGTVLCTESDGGDETGWTARQWRKSPGNAGGGHPG
eukprot:14349154-Alexandrium_andersonii.AAC.2